jgi:hypothetical protein
MRHILSLTSCPFLTTSQHWEENQFRDQNIQSFSHVHQSLAIFFNDFILCTFSYCCNFQKSIHLLAIELFEISFEFFGISLKSALSSLSHS